MQPNAQSPRGRNRLLKQKKIGQEKKETSFSYKIILKMHLILRI